MNAVTYTSDGKLEFDEGLKCRGKIGVQPVLARLPSGNITVESEGDGVEDGRLARTRRAFEEEDPARRHRVEVEVVGRSERADGAETEPMEPHRLPSLWTAGSGAPDTAPGSACSASPRPRADSSAEANTDISVSSGSPAT
ncbi:unannotated protein [freshwater metagenome]|uniref:Unannotated protein n=1 Tax=freshwater metagenome TaxID=449393 RepID=A0A6J7BUB2_9ZZZZ